MSEQRARIATVFYHPLSHSVSFYIFLLSLLLSIIIMIILAIFCIHIFLVFVVIGALAAACYLLLLMPAAAPHCHIDKFEFFDVIL